MAKQKIILTGILIFLTHFGFAQRSTSANTNSGHLIYKTEAPLLELRLVDSPENTNVLFPGSTLAINLEVTNAGNAEAKQCMLFSEETHEQLKVGFDKTYFDLEPGESKIIQMSLSADRLLPPEPVTLMLGIDELNGYNLFPANRFTFFVTDKPDQDLTVIDLAVQDAMGFSFFDKFDEVSIYFRIQNCSPVEQTNIVATTSFLEGTHEEDFNTNLHIGSLAPGETFDVFGDVSSGVTADNIGVNFNLSSDQSNFSQTFYFEFNEDYNTPDDMITDGCGQFHPQLSLAFNDFTDYDKLPPKDQRPDRIAIVVVNNRYYDLEIADIYSDEIRAITSSLSEHQGFHPNNVHVLYDLEYEVMQDMLTLSGSAFRPVRRALRAAPLGAQMSFYFIGYGAADLHHDELYYLPVNYLKNTAVNKHKISTILNKIYELKESYGVRFVESYFILDYVIRSDYGFFDYSQSDIYNFHKDKEGFITFFSSTPNQTNEFPENNISGFTDFYTSGLQGRADKYGRGYVTAEGLITLMKDEFIGIPSRNRKNNKHLQMPFYFGDSFILF